MARLPNLPVEEEGRLGDPRLRENFVERVFAYRTPAALFVEPAGRVGDVVPLPYRAQADADGAFAGGVQRTRPACRRRQRPAPLRVRGRLRVSFMRALTAIATPKRQANVLQHMLGYFKTALDADARAELLALIEEHRIGRIPLIVPITLFRHHVRRLSVGVSRRADLPRPASARD